MKRATRILFLALRAAFGVGLLIYLGYSGAIHWSALLGLASVWRVTLAVLALLLADAAVTAWRLCVLLRPRGLQLSFLASFRLTLIGIFFNACLPGSTGGDVVRIYYATQGNRDRRTEVATVLLLDRGIGMFALLVWPLLAAPLFPAMIGASGILRGLLGTAAVLAAAMLVGFLLCLPGRAKHSRLLSWASRELPLGAYAEKIFDTVNSYGRNWGAAAAAVVLSLVAHTLAVAATLLVAVATNPQGVTWEMAVLIPLGHLVNALPVTPGGLGVGEAAFNQLFALAGLSGGAEALLGWRLLTLLIGLIGLAFYLQGRQRYVLAAEDFAPANFED